MANNLTISHCVAHDNLNGQPPFTSNDGCGFDLDGGTTNSVIEYSLAFGNAGPGVLVCDFGAPIVTHNNTVRYSVSYNDGLSSLNGATGLNFWTPSVLADTLVVGNTFISSNSVPIIAPTSSGEQYPGISLLANALISLGPSPGSSPIDFGSAPPGALLRGNEYWTAPPASLSIKWAGVTFSSLAAFRNATGQETNADGSPAGSDSDPRLAYNSSFFQSCVPWLAAYPALPNSPKLDAIRGFGGC
jgi:hypothetical protein